MGGPAVRHSAGWPRSAARNAATSRPLMGFRYSEHLHRSKPMVPCLSRSCEAGVPATPWRALERRLASRRHPRTKMPHMRPGVHADPSGPELLPTLVPGAQVANAARESTRLGACELTGPLRLRRVYRASRGRATRLGNLGNRSSPADLSLLLLRRDRDPDRSAVSAIG
jgi:hypothetical protein